MSDFMNKKRYGLTKDRARDLVYVHSNLYVGWTTLKL